MQSCVQDANYVRYSKQITHLLIKLAKNPLKYVNTNNCIYAITCNDCNMVNIGQTGRMVSDRIAGHRSDIKQSILGNNKLVETADHFKTTKHSSYSVAVLDNNKNWTINDRLFYEDLYIAKLKTLKPQGMNSRHNDIVKYFYSII